MLKKNWASFKYRFKMKQNFKAKALDDKYLRLYLYLIPLCEWSHQKEIIMDGKVCKSFIIVTVYFSRGICGFIYELWMMIWPLQISEWEYLIEIANENNKISDVTNCAKVMEPNRTTYSQGWEPYTLKTVSSSCIVVSVEKRKPSFQIWRVIQRSS